MTEFLFIFEREHGMISVYICEESLEAAIDYLCKRYPDDVGADGVVQYTNEVHDYEHAIDW